MNPQNLDQPIINNIPPPTDSLELLRTDFSNHQHRDYDKTPRITERGILLSDVTTDDVSTTAHGFTPKAPNSTSQYLRGDATWATPAFLTTAYDYQVFTTVGSNNWTKPAGATANSLVYVQIWAGGGGGAGVSASGQTPGGGGGGEYVDITFRASDLSGTTNMTIGDGGAGGVGAANGSNGSNTTFFSGVVTAHGGKGGNTDGVTVGTGGRYDTTINDSSSGGSGGLSNASGLNALKGGGGGGGTWGGNSPVGGTSSLGGKGGDTPSGNSAGVDGSAPAGGGSAATRNSGSGNLNGGKGGRGEIRVWTIL